MKLITNELLPVYETDTGEKVVDGRELHEFLKVGRDFTSWMKDRIEKYGFEEETDFAVTLTKTGERQNVIRHDYILRLDMAKEVAMVEHNEKGSRARKYFIEVEKRYKSLPQISIPQSLPEALRLAATLAEEKEALLLKAEADKPKVLFADAVSASKTSILVGELAKILKQNGVHIGPNRFFTWLRENGYLINRRGTDYNMPTQRSMELGLFEIKETSISHSDGHITVSKTPKVTGKGQIYFINKHAKGA